MANAMEAIAASARAAAASLRTTGNANSAHIYRPRSLSMLAAAECTNRYQNSKRFGESGGGSVTVLAYALKAQLLTAVAPAVAVIWCAARNFQTAAVTNMVIMRRSNPRKRRHCWSGLLSRCAPHFR